MAPSELKMAQQNTTRHSTTNPLSVTCFCSAQGLGVSGYQEKIGEVSERSERVSMKTRIRATTKLTLFHSITFVLLTHTSLLH